MEILFGHTAYSSGSILMYFPMMLIIGIIYFLMIRPENQRKQNHLEMLKNLKSGDKIITRGGIHAKIVNFQGKEDSLVIIDTGENSKLTISKSFISNIIK